ncbi:Protein TANC2 [Hordeum vulgare]|nr:Protein TANC2 [Hordeum vulgare]
MKSTQTLRHHLRKPLLVLLFLAAAAQIAMAVEPEQPVAALGDQRSRPRTPLEHAVDGGNLPALRYLLDHGADLTQEGDDGLTVLHHAARKGTTNNATPTAIDVSLFFWDQGLDVLGFIYGL